jgi:hypothetical protein
MICVYAGGGLILSPETENVSKELFLFSPCSACSLLLSILLAVAVIMNIGVLQTSDASSFDVEYLAWCQLML